ncbi:MAG TPA: hypothetical protein VFU23_00605 [Gemmatimonadales bacterium]|nr:hypothetical protein [Gemmatimonadales bacterium]
MIVRVLMLVGATVGGAVGWWLGAPAGFMTGFIVSTVCSGVGLYFARRWAIQYWP